MKVGPTAKLAWQDGVFQITSAQQVDFMHRLQVSQLPIKLAHLNAVRKVLSDDAENDRGVLIYSKTGTSLPRNAAGLGWWVGFVDNLREPKLSCAFALKVELKTLDNRAERIAFGKTLLKKMGCLATPR
jgi:beta-lactamase class D